MSTRSLCHAPFPAQVSVEFVRGNRSVHVNPRADGSPRLWRDGGARFSFANRFLGKDLVERGGIPANYFLRKSFVFGDWVN